VRREPISTRFPRAAGDRPTLGDSATPLDRFDGVETGDGDRLIYDRGTEEAWIQSDLYLARESCI
jgi:hypothetical protein